MDRLGTYHGFICDDHAAFGPMIKWTLNRDNEENSIVASRTRYCSGFCTPYTIAGTNGPFEDGKTPVDLKIKNVSPWFDTRLTGYFDSEDSIKGTTLVPDGSSGEFVFKRDPDFFRLYPAPSIINARERCKFAMMVILDHIRRESWSPSCVLRRIKDAKRCIELTARGWYHGRKLDGDEYGGYCRLLSFYESDARFAHQTKQGHDPVPRGLLVGFPVSADPVNIASPTGRFLRC
jgi:hypothetical protein